MVDRRPLVLDPTTGLPAEMPSGDLVPSDALPSGGGGSVPSGGTTGQVLTKTSSTDYAASWQTPSGSGGGYDDWSNLRSILTVLSAQLSAARMGFVDGWIDSLLDTSGLTMANCAGSFSAGSATGSSAGIASATMTGNSAPSGVASASSILGAGWDAWRAFNRTNTDDTDCWLTGTVPTYGTPGTYQWLKYQFPSAVTISTYLVRTRNYGDPTWPKRWILQGSNDNSAWTDLDTQDYAFTGANQSNTFTISSPASFTYYRMLVQQAVSGAPYLAIGELQMQTASSAPIVESAPVTVPATAATFMVDISASTGSTFTVQIDAGGGAGWQTVTMTRTVVSASVDQLSGVISTAGTSAKVKITGDTAARVVYGFSLFWK